MLFTCISQQTNSFLALYILLIIGTLTTNSPLSSTNFDDNIGDEQQNQYLKIRSKYIGSHTCMHTKPLCMLTYGKGFDSEIGNCNGFSAPKFVVRVLIRFVDVAMVI